MEKERIVKVYPQVMMGHAAVNVKFIDKTKMMKLNFCVQFFIVQIKLTVLLYVII